MLRCYAMGAERPKGRGGGRVATARLGVLRRCCNMRRSSARRPRANPLATGTANTHERYTDSKHCCPAHDTLDVKRAYAALQLDPLAMPMAADTDVNTMCTLGAHNHGAWQPGFAVPLIREILWVRPCLPAVPRTETAPVRIRRGTPAMDSQRLEATRSQDFAECPSNVPWIYLRSRAPTNYAGRLRVTNLDNLQKSGRSRSPLTPERSEDENRDDLDALLLSATPRCCRLPMMLALPRVGPDEAEFN